MRRMRVLKFVAGLLAAVMLHYLGVAVTGGSSLLIDLFLVVTVFNALDGDLVAGMSGGLVAGLVADALSGGLYGLHGFADTIIGYGAAFAAQRLVIQRPTAVFLLFMAAAAAQLILIMGLLVILAQDPPLPGFVSVAARVLTTGVAGVVGFVGHKRLSRAREKWKRSRRARLR